MLAIVAHATGDVRPAQKHHSADTQPDMLRGIDSAVPQHDIGKLPSTDEQYRKLKLQTEQTRPAVEAAKRKSRTLDAQARTLRQKLIAMAARVQRFEAEKISLDAKITSLEAQNARLSAGFANDRVAVSRLLAVLERVQYDMPPPIVVRPDDALSAVHSSMLIGASLPRIYGVAAALARRIAALRQTRANLIAERALSARNATNLATARTELDKLLTLKLQEADQAAVHYGDLQERLDIIAQQASDLKALLDRIAGIRQNTGQKTGILAKTAEHFPRMMRGTLLRPVVGEMEEGGLEGVGGSSAPGITFVTSPAAQVIAPADGEVLFAGPYHKTGKVLILEMTAGYDLVMAGLDRVAVQPGNQLLAGEPLGSMPQTGYQARLYLELRQNGKGMNPTPWLSVDLKKAKKS